MVHTFKFIQLSKVVVRNAFKQRIEELAEMGETQLNNGNLTNVVRERLAEASGANEHDVIEGLQDGRNFWYYGKTKQAVNFRNQYKQYFK